MHNQHATHARQYTSTQYAVHQLALTQSSGFMQAVTEVAYGQPARNPGPPGSRPPGRATAFRVYVGYSQRRVMYNQHATQAHQAVDHLEVQQN